MIVVYIIIGLIILFFVLSALGPREYAVDRSIVIDRQRPEVYDYLRSLKEQDEWSPWMKRDPNNEKKYTGTDKEVGFVSYWKGNKQVGEGEQELKHLVPNERIETELRFLKPWKSTSQAFFALEDEGADQTRVTWGFKGENSSAIARVMGLMMNMDKMIGKDFEEGLGNLKHKMEGESEEA